ncbi:response regulator transcription factor [Sphingomonas sp. HDW15A]|uniref:response regulator n=1 Tax=Sphingomonas sp. HDW15A TaxID=2714942 RepID=UPI00140BDAEB|nr:response regulator transcription factor [Sphingomonas sp. HDW15A]QIK95468.1 response regulator transcription factor [Sphingomonas sp. HDW15A]
MTGGVTLNRPSIRVMLVDDHPLLRQGVKALIETRACYSVVGEASDGLEAVDVAMQTRPDIAVIDYTLPGRNGLVLAETLKRLLPRLQVILFTLCDREEVIFQALQAGVRGYILKSEPEEHLLKALDAASLGRNYFSATFCAEAAHKLAKGMPTLPSSLTRREREVTQLIAEGRLNKQVAHLLHISIKTVESHRSAIMRKLELNTTADLVRFAVRNQLVEA